MRDARSPWSWSGNSYRGHMAWKTAAAGKLHLILRPWEWIFTFCWFSWARGRCCADLFCVFLSVYKRGPFIFLWKKKVFRPNMCDLCFHELESVWIWVLIRQTVKRVVKLHVFVLTELFFLFPFAGKFTLTSAAALNSLSPSLFDIRFAADIHPLGAPAASAVLPSLFLPPTSLGFLLALRYYLSPPPPLLLPSTSFSHHPLSLSLQSPTSSWTPLLVSCSWLIIPHGNIFSVDVRELLLLLMKILNNAAPAQPHQKKKNVDGGGGKAGNQLFLLSSKYCHVWWRFYKLLRCIFSIC